jgi:hypothetical protein
MLRLRPVVLACGIATSGLLLSALVVAPALARPAAGPTAFRPAIEVTLPANADVADGAGVYGVGCAAAGSCVAGGGYTTKADDSEAFVVGQVRGTWKRATEVRLPSGAAGEPDAEVNGIACPAIGYCVAVGTYRTTSAIGLGFVVTESHGKWGTATNVSLPKNSSASSDSQLEAVACTGRGACEAAGSYTDSSADEQAMSVTEVAGHWRRTAEITMPSGALANPDAFPVSITCVKTGDCELAGSYEIGTYPDYVPMVATQTRGRWLRAVRIGEPAGAVPDGSAISSAACWSAGHCIAVGGYAVAHKGERAMAAIQSHGRWARAVQEKLFPARHVAGGYLEAISCAPASGCVAAGNYLPTSKTSLLFTVLYARSRWQHASALRLPSGAASAKVQFSGLYAVSCLRDGYCAVGGYYRNRAGVYLPMVATN